MTKKTYKQILELTKNPHYVLSEEDIEVLSEDGQEYDYYPDNRRSKREKNKFNKEIGSFDKTYEIEE